MKLKKVEQKLNLGSEQKWKQGAVKVKHSVRRHAGLFSFAADP